MIDLDFKLFNAMEIPDPAVDEATFVLLCENRHDGVGDFDHLKTYISMIREQIQNKNYKIKPIVAVHRFDPPQSDEDKLKNARADYVENELINMKKRGDINDYIILRIKNGSIQDEILEKQDNIDEFLSNGIAFMGISYTSYLKVIMEQINKNGQKLVKCPQLNTLYGWNRKSVDEVFDYAGMGLPRGDANARGKDVCYGLPIAKLYTDEEKIQLILNLTQDTENGNQLLQKMLGHSNATYLDIEQYFKEHAIMPGYPQTKIAAINFVLIGILKNLDKNMMLDKNIDFFLPKGIVDLDFLKEMLDKMAPDVKFEIVTPDSKPLPDESGAYKVRIFSGFRLDDEHYSQLYSARNDIGLGSGDNTLIKVVSSDALPFFQDKLGSIRDFNRFGIIPLIEKIIDERSTPEQKENLQKLKEYFKELMSFVNGGPDYPGKFDVSNDGISENAVSFDFNVLRKSFDKYYDFLKRVSSLAKNPKVLAAWKMVAQYLQQNFNYRDNFKGILNGVILMNNPMLKTQVENQKELNFDELKEYVITLNQAKTSTPAASRRKALVFDPLSSPSQLKGSTETATKLGTKSKPTKPN